MKVKEINYPRRSTSEFIKVTTASLTSDFFQLYVSLCELFGVPLKRLKRRYDAKPALSLRLFSERLDHPG